MRLLTCFDLILLLFCLLTGVFVAAAASTTVGQLKNAVTSSEGLPSKASETLVLRSASEGSAPLSDNAAVLSNVNVRPGDRLHASWPANATIERPSSVVSTCMQRQQARNLFV